jgi:pimeloyl-ACP methyl ester carboxylesterase
MSTPPFLDLPACAKATQVATARGTFAVHVAEPDDHRATAVLVPGYTGSKEDFIAVLAPLCRSGVRVIAVDPRGQFDTAGPDESAAYAPAEQGADIAAVIEALTDGAGAVHLLGHSFGGLIARETVIARSPLVRSLTLLGSGPGPVSGTAAERVQLQLAALRLHDLATVQAMREAHAAAEGQPEPRPEIREFLRRRFVAHNHTGLIAVSESLLGATDRVSALRDALSAADIPALVAYGDKDDAWLPDEQRDMAARLGVRHEGIDGAGHSPAAEEPNATAALLAHFWFESTDHR